MVGLHRHVARTAALGVLVLICTLAGVALFVLPAMYLASLQERKADALFQLERLTRLVADRENISAKLEALEAHEAWEYLDDKGADLASLQRRFRQILQAQRIALTRVTPADAGSKTQVATLVISVEFSTTVDKLVAVLADLERQVPYMRFETLTISAPAGQVADRNPLLDIRGTVVTLLSASGDDPHEG